MKVGVPYPLAQHKRRIARGEAPGSADELPRLQESLAPKNLTTNWPSKEKKMTSNEMKSQMSTKQGFIAALDQSGGSTPGALRYYGIPDSAYSGETEMFKLMHEMRVRIMSSPAFTGDKVIGAILFERTMDGQAKGKPVPAFLWEDRGVVPFLKVDKGLEAEADGVQLMKPMPELDALLARAVTKGVYGTKMRSVINLPSKSGIAAVVAQQFVVGDQIAGHGL